MVDYKNIITIEPGKRNGKPCIRGMRITVSDILGWMASGMTINEILNDFDELREEDIYAALSYAADRENKIYQNISHRILEKLPEQFNNSTSAKKEGLLNATDLTIWEFAKRNDLIIVTQDSDFNDLSALFGFPPKIIWIRSGNMRTAEIADILTSNYSSIQTFLDDKALGCFEIIRVQKKKSAALPHLGPA
jgi:predicted nuclease of predicted toxin-antitoxin system